MKTKLLGIAGIAIFLLLAVLLFGSFFFSNLLIDSETQDLAEGKARMQDLLAEMDLPDGFILPPAEEVTIDAGEVTLSGNYYENDTEDGSAIQDGGCAVLLLHGYTGTRYGVMQYAPLFWERGCHLLAYDARGHGESTDTYHTYGYHEKEDGLAAYNWLLAKTGLEPEDVGVTGVSYGAATALQMLPLIEGVAFVLADSPYQDLRSVVAHQAVEQFGSWTEIFVPTAYFIAEQRADFDVDAVSPRSAVSGATVPVLLMHSATDRFTPPANSEAIYANSNQAATELFINEWGSSHAADIVTDYQRYDALVDEFLAAYVGDFGVTNGR